MTPSRSLDTEPLRFGCHHVALNSIQYFSPTPPFAVWAEAEVGAIRTSSGRATRTNRRFMARLIGKGGRGVDGGRGAGGAERAYLRACLLWAQPRRRTVTVTCWRPKALASVQFHMYTS